MGGAVGVLRTDRRVLRVQRMVGGRTHRAVAWSARRAHLLVRCRRSSRHRGRFSARSADRVVDRRCVLRCPTPSHLGSRFRAATPTVGGIDGRCHDHRFGGAHDRDWRWPSAPQSVGCRLDSADRPGREET
uniref:LigA n=1 Tax=Parastrongyloides trichosuri TaxID=131310 RepID=A0A0N4ZGF8_PARTI